MPENRQPYQVQNGPFTPDDEIELIDLLRILWKWKYLIIGGTLVCALAALIISLNMVKVYSIEMALRPGKLKIENGQRIFIDSVTNLKALIESSAFRNEVLSKMGNNKADSALNNIKFKTTILANTDILKVVYETANIDKGISILNLGTQLLIKKYSDYVKYYQKEFEMQSNIKKTELEKLLHSQQSFKKNINTIKTRITDLKSEIESINENTENLIRDQKTYLSKTRDAKEILTALFYSNTIQQNMSLTNDYKNQLSEFEINLENNKQLLAGSESDTKNIANEIENLEFKKNIIENVQVIQPPAYSPAPIKPKIVLNVVLAALVGFFIMLFLSFFVEYIFKVRKQISLNL